MSLPSFQGQAAVEDPKPAVRTLARDYAMCCSTAVLNTTVQTMSTADRQEAMCAFGTPLELSLALPGQSFVELFRRHLGTLAWERIRARQEGRTVDDNRPAAAKRTNGRRSKR